MFGEECARYLRDISEIYDICAKYLRYICDICAKYQRDMCEISGMIWEQCGRIGDNAGGLGETTGGFRSPCKISGRYSWSVLEGLRSDCGVIWRV